VLDDRACLAAERQAPNHQQRPDRRAGPAARPHRPVARPGQDHAGPAWPERRGPGLGRGPSPNGLEGRPAAPQVPARQRYRHRPEPACGEPGPTQRRRRGIGDQHRHAAQQRPPPGAAGSWPGHCGIPDRGPRHGHPPARGAGGGLGGTVAWKSCCWPQGPSLPSTASPLGASIPPAFAFALVPADSRRMSGSDSM